MKVLNPNLEKVPTVTPVQKVKSFSPSVQAIAHANPKANLVTKFAMSKPVGKVLDSKVGKAGVAVGNAVIGGTRRFGRALAAPLKWAGGQIAKEMQMGKAKDDKAKAAGAALNSSYSGKRRGTSNGSMY